jgi:parallel beta-helix repeat protein
MKNVKLISANSIANQKFFFLFAITVILLTFLTGCKKETAFTKEEDALVSLNNINRQTNVLSNIIVTPGSSIQAAINVATPNSVIQIQPGTYNEAIVVNKAGIKLIGLTGSGGEEVIIQNPGGADDGIVVTDAGDGFVLKNVTVKNFLENGVLLQSVNGFTLSNVTAINNGEYGLFPVFCTNGKIEHCTATGHTDTGIYVGQSSNVDLEFNTVFANVNGLEIENCTNVSAEKNHCYDNVCGILSVLLPGLTVKTATNIVIDQNHVHDNNHINFAQPGGFEFFVPSGSGILVVGTDNTTVKENKIRNNNFVGVATVSTLILGALAGIPPVAFADIEPNPDGARIKGNNLFNNGLLPPAGIPLPGVDLLWDGSGTNNCWEGNSFTNSFPATLPNCN